MRTNMLHPGTVDLPDETIGYSMHPFQILQFDIDNPDAVLYFVVSHAAYDSAASVEYI